jgi:hypothetical protein
LLTLAENLNKNAVFTGSVLKFIFPIFWPVTEIFGTR